MLQLGHRTWCNLPKLIAKISVIACTNQAVILGRKVGRVEHLKHLGAIAVLSVRLCRATEVSYDRSASDQTRRRKKAVTLKG